MQRRIRHILAVLLGVCSMTELHSILSQDFVSRTIYYQDRIYRVNSACFDQFCLTIYA